MNVVAPKDSIAGTTPSAQPVRILLVDDQPDNLLSAEAVLESLGEEIVKAESGREALRQLLEHDFAVIVLDVMIPEPDGFAVWSTTLQTQAARPLKPYQSAELWPINRIEPAHLRPDRS